MSTSRTRVPAWELIGVPYSSMREAGGIDHAIGVLRECGLADALGRDVADAGDLTLKPGSGERGGAGILNEQALAELVVATRDAVLGARSRHRSPLLLGGDCPVLLGALAALEDPGLIMLDGHEDACPPASSPTGEASDSELAMALGSVPEPPTFWLHLDLDVLRSDQFAAVDYPQPGGLTWEAVEQLVDGALADPRCAGLSVVIYNPRLDPDRQDARKIIDFLSRALPV